MQQSNRHNIHPKEPGSGSTLQELNKNELMMECIPGNDKVEEWLRTSHVNHRHWSNKTNNLTINLRSKLKLAQQPSLLVDDRIPSLDEEEYSSVDTTRYIKSNRTKTRNKIKTMTIKHYCYLSTGQTNRINKSKPIVGSLSVKAKRKPRLEESKHAIRPRIEPKKKRKTKLKNEKSKNFKHGKSPSSASTKTDTMIENRFSRRIAKKKLNLNEEHPDVLPVPDGIYRLRTSRQCNSPTNVSVGIRRARPIVNRRKAVKSIESECNT